MMTIHPKYEYIDPISGDKVTKTLRQKNDIPDGIEVKQYSNGLCYEKMNILLGNLHGEVENKDSLMDEPGIPELMELYYDDNYDYNSGRFLGMSPETKKDYEEDLRIFYNVFTGNNVDSLPENIRSFNDIKLKDYKQEKGCQGSNPILNTSMKGSLTNKLFLEYASNMVQMVKNANENQEQLLSVINKLFVYSVNPMTNEKEIRVNPALNEENIHDIVLETRAIIMKLYLTCEIDYTNGIKIYEAIVEDKILETSQKQINHLGKLSESLAFSENK
jgi:hypothetical protein